METTDTARNPAQRPAVPAREHLGGLEGEWWLCPVCDRYGSTLGTLDCLGRESLEQRGLSDLAACWLNEARPVRVRDGCRPLHIAEGGPRMMLSIRRIFGPVSVETVYDLADACVHDPPPIVVIHCGVEALTNARRLAGRLGVKKIVPVIYGEGLNAVDVCERANTDGEFRARLDAYRSELQAGLYRLMYFDGAHEAALHHWLALFPKPETP